MHLSRWLCGIIVVVAIVAAPVSLHAIDFPSFGFGSDKDKEAEKEKKDSDEEEEETGEFDTKVSTPLIAEYVQVSGLHPITLHGVGLVTGLNGTGGDTPPSMFRTALIEDMRQHRNIKNPNQILNNPNNALVVIKAYLPPLIRKGEAFDIEAYTPEGSPVKSLNGGWLLEVDLSEQALIPGRGMLEGHRYAKAEGPILVSMGSGDEQDQAGVLKRGRIVGGAKSLIERNLMLYVRNDLRSFRNSRRVADSIGKRFFEYDEHGQRKPLAEAKTDQKIELKVMSKYKDNFPRYLQVIRSIAFREEPVAWRVRLRKLKTLLLAPETAEDASIKLEAIGDESIPILKAGLQSESLEVRFHSATALAYLADQDGLAELANAVRTEPAFRVFGLAALASIDVAESHVQLRGLLNEASAETRYGAFRALTTLDKNDPFIRGEMLNKQFNLHVLETEGPPLVHLTNRRKSEVVLFGADQRFKTPFAARAGIHVLVNADAGSDTVRVCRIEVGKEEQRRTVSTRIADVIRAVTEMDASYPDVAMMLAQAGATQNLPGRIEIDSLPQAGRLYVRPTSEVASSAPKKARIGSSNGVPNMFASFTNPNDKMRRKALNDEHITPVGLEVEADEVDEKNPKANDKDSNKDEKQKASKSEAEKKMKSKSPEGLESAKAATKGKPRTAKKSTTEDDAEATGHEDSEGPKKSDGRSWNPLSYFRGRGQSEPEIDESDLPAKKKSGEVVNADFSSDNVPEQTEP